MTSPWSKPVTVVETAKPADKREDEALQLAHMNPIDFDRVLEHTGRIGQILISEAKDQMEHMEVPLPFAAMVTNRLKGLIELLKETYRPDPEVPVNYVRFMEAGRPGFIEDKLTEWWEGLEDKSKVDTDLRYLKKIIFEHQKAEHGEA